jgi:N-acetylglucosaminyldiphosphoundecaprenol N-acetyl-beta-D-mannosaminyltransferase
MLHEETESLSLLTPGIPAPARAEVMGVDFDLVDEEGAIAHVLGSLDAGIGGWIMTPNLDILRQVVKAPEFVALAHRADLSIADGMPIVWALRALGHPTAVRVPGSTLTLSLTAAAARAGRSVFLLGGAPGVADRAAAALVGANPGLVIAGTSCPPLGFERDPAALARVRADVRAAQPDIVFVGLGFPKQERLIVQLRDELPGAWLAATGASIAMAAGHFRRAPQWMQDCGLEWAWRLALEPRRLFRRYIIEDLPFAARLALHVAGRKVRARRA